MTNCIGCESLSVNEKPYATYVCIRNGVNNLRKIVQKAKNVEYTSLTTPSWCPKNEEYDEEDDDYDYDDDWDYDDDDYCDECGELLEDCEC